MHLETTNTYFYPLLQHKYLRFLLYTVSKEPFVFVLVYLIEMIFLLHRLLSPLWKMDGTSTTRKDDSSMHPSANGHEQTNQDVRVLNNEHGGE